MRGPSPSPRWASLVSSSLEPRPRRSDSKTQRRRRTRKRRKRRKRSEPDPLADPIFNSQYSRISRDPKRALADMAVQRISSLLVNSFTSPLVSQTRFVSTYYLKPYRPGRFAGKQVPTTLREEGSLNTKVHSTVMTGDLDKSLLALNELIRAGIPIRTNSINAVMRLSVIRRRPEVTIDLIDLAKGAGIVPDERTVALAQMGLTGVIVSGAETKKVGFEDAKKKKNKEKKEKKEKK
eukprot:TRINITY_DN4431_c0_g1_i1.p2 TRINITY_DN4431_c0_g1~~TRINITY_DN4431_c0_g1_i1.p2  ORF type:complete len:236 (-),score=77.63 TRINITY_DN4431_c0_g1_i1:168-875(-)